MKLIVNSISIFLVVILWIPGESVAQKSSGEVIYHVCQRSFYDSDGDHIGDLKGLNEKLDYLQELGVTSILLMPLYQSPYYHNYFADDFEKIDPAFGTTKDLITLVTNLHRRGMKLYMDMETQYVTGEHVWYKDAVGNPSSKYSDYLLFNGPGNTKPEPIIYDLTDLTGYNGATRKVTTVNLNSPKVLEYNYKLFSYWMDPDGNGKFDDGVDGFRLDHAMDDLDNKGKFRDLFTKFWSPLISRLKERNPAVIVFAEQAAWASYGFDYLEKANVDEVFAFRLAFAIASFDAKKIMSTADTTFGMTPKGKSQIVFIENHDFPRFASGVRKDPGRERAGAALNLLLGGVPSIYYGQELGMFGAGGFGKFGNTDGNDIPQREAFEWYKDIDGKGMAIWYKDTGPWWTQTNLKASDGISLEEEKNQPASLWNFYKTMIALRKTDPALSFGGYKTIHSDNYQVVTFFRSHGVALDVVMINLTGEHQSVSIDLKANGESNSKNDPRRLYGEEGITHDKDNLQGALRPFGVQVWSIRRP